MTVRGCAYDGAKGVVCGPVKDQITICHGRSVFIPEVNDSELPLILQSGPGNSVLIS
jgi:hypothetical protein